jgi:hypothetical protein
MPLKATEKVNSESNLQTMLFALESPEQKEDTPDNPEDVELPRFPMVPDAVIGESHMNERKSRLEHWLQCVLAIPVNRDYHETVI